MILAPAIAFSAARGGRDGFWPWEKSLLAAVWAVPLFTRIVAVAVPVSLGLIVMAGYFGFLAWHGLAGSFAMRRSQSA
jgi:alpha-1,2-mannosyltransferase